MEPIEEYQQILAKYPTIEEVWRHERQAREQLGDDGYGERIARLKSHLVEKCGDDPATSSVAVDGILAACARLDALAPAILYHRLANSPAIDRRELEAAWFAAMGFMTKGDDHSDARVAAARGKIAAMAAEDEDRRSRVIRLPLAGN